MEQTTRDAKGAPGPAGDAPAPPAVLLQVNTFQVVLATANVTSWALFLYKDIQWATGMASSGSPHNGWGCITAQLDRERAEAAQSSGSRGDGLDDPALNLTPGLQQRPAEGLRHHPRLQDPRCPACGRHQHMGVLGFWACRIDALVVPNGHSYNAQFVPLGASFWNSSASGHRCHCGQEGQARCWLEGCQQLWLQPCHFGRALLPGIHVEVELGWGAPTPEALVRLVVHGQEAVVRSEGPTGHTLVNAAVCQGVTVTTEPWRNSFFCDALLWALARCVRLELCTRRLLLPSGRPGLAEPRHPQLQVRQTRAFPLQPGSVPCWRGFQGTGTYHLAHSCGPDPNPGGSSFSLEASNRNYRSWHVCFLYHVEVDGQVVSLLAQLGPEAHVWWGQGLVMLQVGTRLQVWFNSRNTLFQQVGPEYWGCLCGLSGNFSVTLVMTRSSLLSTSCPAQPEVCKVWAGQAGSELFMADTPKNRASCHLAPNTPFPKTPQGQCSDMQEVALSLLVLLAGLPALDANDPEDWHSLRVSGLICAGVLCALGIIVLMSGKCKCKFSQKPRRHPGDPPPLITTGSAHNC
ncbi:hypothetical protein CB1_000743040 [Camelus ferus]|nr:hypothetical protein CB1_000743040 [Camelus ferus]